VWGHGGGEGGVTCKNSESKRSRMIKKGEEPCHGWRSLMKVGGGGGWYDPAKKKLPAPALSRLPQEWQSAGRGNRGRGCSSKERNSMMENHLNEIEDLGSLS